MSTTDRVTVMCPRCQQQREVSEQTAAKIRAGTNSPWCRSCGVSQGMTGPRGSAPPPTDQTWRASAACLGVDPELFYPLGEPGSKAYERASQPARAVCADCPVIAECLEDSLRVGDIHGIRGGLDPTERAAQFPQPKRTRKPAYPCAACGIGMDAPKGSGNNKPRYCSEACRSAARREQKVASKERRKREVAA